MTIKTTADTTLMKNQKQAQVMSPQKKFQALQTAQGQALFFSIGSDNVFYLTRQQDGDRAGWIKTDLSSCLNQYHGNPVSVKTFAVAQHPTDNTLELIIAVEGKDQDYLYSALNVVVDENSWQQSLPWQVQAYDCKTVVLPQVKVTGLYLARSSGVSFIVADVLASPGSANNFIDRFFLDPSKTLTGSVWNQHSLAVDLNAQTIFSCLGKKSAQRVDGIYTLGAINERDELLYAPLYNAFNIRIPAPPSRLLVPQGTSAIATSAAAGGETNLFAAGNGELLFFAASGQNDGDSGLAVLSHPLFSAVTSLQASSDDTRVCVWGLNQQGEIFYTACPLGQEADPARWSLPMPVAVNVTGIASYVDNQYGNNVIFAHIDGRELIQLTQDPVTTLWSTRNIVLPATSVDDVLEFNTYTSHVLLTDENNVPQHDVSVAITASSPVSVYVNNRFAVLSPTLPLNVSTGPDGTLTILQETQSLSTVCYTLTPDSGGEAMTVNPMQALIATLATVKSGSDLANVTVTNADGSVQPLVDGSVSAADKEASARAIQQFVAAAKQVPQNGLRIHRPALKRSPAMLSAPFIATESSVWGIDFDNGQSRYHSGIDAINTFGNGSLGLLGTADSLTVADALRSVDNAIESLAGDVFNWIRNALDDVKNFFVQVVDGVWHFFVTIGEALYTFVLDCFESIISAVEFIFNKIKVFIEDLIKWLGFLFVWQDILVTHRVLKNVFLLNVQNAIDSMSNVKSGIASAFKSMQDDVNKWADIPGIDQTPNQVSAANPAFKGQNSAEANYGLYQFKSNASIASSSFSLPVPADDIFTILMDLLRAEEATLLGAYHAIKTDIIDCYGSLTATQIMKRFLAIVTDTLLQSAENILLAAVDVFIQLANGIVAIMTAKIDIPVISWLYKKIADDDLSFLDLICLVSAIPATLIYKIAAGKAPFPRDDAFTSGLLSASSWTDYRSLFLVPSQNAGVRSYRGVALGAGAVLDKKKINLMSFITGFCALVGSAVMIWCSTRQAANDIAKLPASRLVATINAVANVFYVSPNYSSILNWADSRWYQQMNNYLTVISLVKGFTLDICCAGKPVSSWCECLLNLVWNVPVIANCIYNKIGSKGYYKALIPESIGNFSFNIGGMITPIPAQIDDPKGKAIAYLVQYAFMVSYGICMPIAGGLNQFGDDA